MHFLQKQSDYFSNDPRTSILRVYCPRSEIDAIRSAFGVTKTCNCAPDASLRLNTLH